ncbi:Fur family transcriptional regulator, peroxide stress response regulator [Sporobacter termitidis DSM 10068]|uniref:Fur family transcriptional regulator, peroxide stress response regulator n=1 Tax=Sporobacter termitidis DSM 10068 TaxID=1123282 RepID=A0A1M5Z8R1_9FIRM|nr:transcriptional repressor [Sporobacter termitidis]SHI20574.1 Fur family transcriptional regulator, peroxide stress response regulator [Sporobacter termitidis DSM 10068]
MNSIKKHSRKREAILEKICSTTTHPSAVWVYEELRKEIPDLSLGTVYRNISVFKDEGLIISVGVVNGQERFDGNVEEHTHFICLDCGDVLDVDAALDPSFTEKVEAENNVDVLFRQLTFYGRCLNCSNKSQKAFSK